MKLKLVVLAVATALVTGCSSPKKVEAPSVSAINNQKLTSTFNRQSIRINWECVWGTGMFGLTDSLCLKTEVGSIEATGYAFSNGNSIVNREIAFSVAHNQALDKLNRFLVQDIRSTRVVHTLSKNLEKANDRVKQKLSDTEEVGMSDDEANKDTNFAIRENTNDTVRTFTENIRTSTEGILKCVYIKDERIVDKQTVAVTIRYDRETGDACRNIRRQIIR